MSHRGDRVQNHFGRSVDGESFIHESSSPIISPGMVGANTFPDWASWPHGRSRLDQPCNSSMSCHQRWFKEFQKSCGVLSPSRNIAMSHRGGRIQNQLGPSVDGESFTHGRASPIISPGTVAASTPTHRSLRSHGLQNSVWFCPRETQCSQV